MTRKPSRSQRSRNSGAGGLWEVRMALAPIALSSRSRRSHTRSGTAAPAPARLVMQVDPPELDAEAVQQEALVHVPGDAADAERRGGEIGRTCTVKHLRPHRIEVRRLHRP